MSPRNKAIQKSAQQLAKEVVAAKALRDTISALTSDTDAIRDTIEGETDLHGAVANVMDYVRDDEILVAGIERMQQTLAARKDRLESRISFYRSAVEQAMLIGEIQTLELPDATVTVRKVSPRLQVIEESKIPAAYWKQPEPTLDRKALTEALKAKTPIEGAILDNGGVTLSVRRS